ncbi:hypothetical protein BV898_00868 [Hypsibius exemplaris]|uniref:PID domain-containing protein n=1 Tax=Hypsibius exemplaris TaxID=2072580 RepID=A0A1W0XCH2_HYPEX|nr:hypothetical protein BV898_00868 [Hypsibius exemplaris]
MPLGRKNHQDNIKRSSYYVCFIGAKESPVVRDHDYGREFVYPAMEYLLRSVVEAGPISNAPKITLQVSGKGLKIMQNVSRSGLVQSKISAGKTDTLRHFIPHHCITCAFQGPAPYDDLVATILLIYNPATRCPVHIHVYRCDSNNTASVLTQQLVSMSQRPENQMKFAEIEAKLSGRGLLHPTGTRNHPEPQQHVGQPPRHLADTVALSSNLHRMHHHHSDDQSSGGRTSNSSPGTSDSGVATTVKHDVVRRPLSVTSSNGKSLNNHTPQPTSPIANVAKLTTEFQQRLQTRDSAPMLLPPKDYDTVNRQRGKTGISLLKSEEEEAEGPARSSKNVDASAQTSGRGVSSDFFDSSKRSQQQESALTKHRLTHHSTDNILDMRRKKPASRAKSRADSDDDDWHVDDETEERGFVGEQQREQPIITRLSDFDKELFQERLKRYSSLSDVFGEVNDPIVKLVAMKKPAIPLGTPPPPAAPSSSSDASAAYRPRPYYFTAEEAELVENEVFRRTAQQEGKRVKEEQARRLAGGGEQQESPRVEEQVAIIQSQNVRPSLPVKRNQRPVVNERVRPASFYERIRFDDRDFQEGRFVRPEMVYYQYRS